LTNDEEGTGMGPVGKDGEVTVYDQNLQDECRAACPHNPPCPTREARDAEAARIVSDHLSDCGYALLCNGVILLEGDGTLPVPAQRTPRAVVAPAHG
jgi:hypothetical protein